MFVLSSFYRFKKTSNQVNKIADNYYQLVNSFEQLKLSAEELDKSLLNLE